MDFQYFVVAVLVKLAGQSSRLSHFFHDMNTFGMLLLGARVAQVMALDCIDVSCHQSGRVV